MTNKKLEEKIEEPQKFEGQILTCSARDWCESESKCLRNYLLIDVIHSRRPGTIFEDEIPKEAEVVTDYIFSNSNYGLCERGTALVPRSIK